MTELVSIAALVIALLSLVASGWTVLIERRRDRKAEARERRSEASKVQAYVATLRGQALDAHGRRPWGIVVRNDGESSLTNLVIWSRYAKDPLADAGRLPSAGKYLTVPPGHYFIARSYSGDYPWAFPVTLDATTDVHPIMNSASWLVDRFEFADANGQCWRRTYDAEAVETGELEEIPSTELTPPDYRRMRR